MYIYMYIYLIYIYTYVHIFDMSEIKDMPTKIIWKSMISGHKTCPRSWSAASAMRCWPMGRLNDDGKILRWNDMENMKKIWKDMGSKINTSPIWWSNQILSFKLYCVRFGDIWMVLDDEVSWKSFPRWFPYSSLQSQHCANSVTKVSHQNCAFSKLGNVWISMGHVPTPFGRWRLSSQQICGTSLVN